MINNPCDRASVSNRLFAHDVLLQENRAADDEQVLHDDASRGDLLYIKEGEEI